jgi:hypothetical protein
MTEWVHHPRMNWKKQVEALHDLLVRHGPQRTLGAIERAVLDGKHHVNAITWVLDQEVA